ncbi:hypothetical protein [Streptomyces sp. NPDC059009]|uniref:hypothetical protein n=1 Tax=Streptomyces sp. NPDC059009 TaxID=3346694 RepID=UPI0036A5DEDF
MSDVHPKFSAGFESGLEDAQEQIIHFLNLSGMPDAAKKVRTLVLDAGDMPGGAYAWEIAA